MSLIVRFLKVAGARLRRLIGITLWCLMSLPESAKEQAMEFVEMMKSANQNPDFGFDRESVAHVDGFVERMSKSARRNERRRAEVVSSVGSYLGEAILAAYGGNWV